MKRFDRAMYALFLLALLADVARARVLVSVAGASDGGLILSVAGPLAAGANGGAVLLPRRPEALTPEVVRGASLRSALERWASVLRGPAKPSRAAHSPAPVLMAMAGCSAGFAKADPPREFEPSAASPAIFEHLGRPAP